MFPPGSLLDNHLSIYLAGLAIGLAAFGAAARVAGGSTTIVGRGARSGD